MNVKVRVSELVLERVNVRVHETAMAGVALPAPVGAHVLRHDASAHLLRKSPLDPDACAHDDELHALLSFLPL